MLKIPESTLVSIGHDAESRRPEIEADMNLPPDLVNRLKSSGLLRLWVSERDGGSQSDLKSLTQAVQTLAYYEGSISWVGMVTGTASLISGYLDADSGEKIFGRSDAMVGGWAAPAGRAKRVDGGLIVSGRWGWGSGTTHCTTVSGGVMIAPSEPDGKPMSGLAMFAPKDVHWHDNWQVNGLHGTASGDYEVADLFVPDNHWISFPVTKPVVDAPLYRLSFFGALAAGVASVGLGLAQRALDEIKQLGLTKKPAMARKTLSEKEIVRYQLAETESRYLAAAAFLEQAIDQNWSEAQQGTPSVKAKGQLRMAATHAVKESAIVVDWAYKIGGGSTIWDGVKLQELQRDMSIVTQHGLIAPSNFELLGKVSFGLPVNELVI
ncbi:MAG: acyl-CoA dehydrogenase family protein [Anaerolineae bacterium]